MEDIDTEVVRRYHIEEPGEEALIENQSKVSIPELLDEDAKELSLVHAAIFRLNQHMTEVSKVQPVVHEPVNI